MLRRHRLLALPLFVILTTPALADSATPPPSYPAVPLLSTSTTILGEKIRYPKGDAHLTAAIATLAPGARTIPHRHDVPLFAYILEGELTVDYGPDGKRTYVAGEALLEAFRTPHNGRNGGDGNVRLLAVFIGAEGVANTVMEPE